VSIVLFIAGMSLVALASAGRLLAAVSDTARRKIAETEAPSQPPPTFRSALISFALAAAAVVALFVLAR
jgi:hypothetical protein